MANRITRYSRPIIRQIPDLNIVVKVDDVGVVIRGYRRRRGKRVTWAQLASLADDSRPVVKACEVNDGLEILKAMGVTIASDESEVPPPQ